MSLRRLNPWLAAALIAATIAAPAGAQLRADVDLYGLRLEERREHAAFDQRIADTGQGVRVHAAFNDRVFLTATAELADSHASLPDWRYRQIRAGLGLSHRFSDALRAYGRLDYVDRDWLGDGGAFAVGADWRPVNGIRLYGEAGVLSLAGAEGNELAGGIAGSLGRRVEAFAEYRRWDTRFLNVHAANAPTPHTEEALRGGVRLEIGGAR